MKLLYTLLFIGSVSLSNAQDNNQFSVGLNTFVDFPVKSTMSNMSANGGIGLQFAYSPFPSTPFYLELKSGWGLYSMQTLQQTFIFDNGAQTTTDVSYTSKMSKYLFGFKTMIGHEYRLVRGFVTPQIGIARMSSKIAIADPEDEDDCKVLDSKTTQRFIGAVYGGEAGVDLDLKLLTDKVDQGEIILFAAASYLRGFKHFQYTNVKYMQDGPHDTHVEHDDRDINAQFINLSTNQIHEHKIGELYHSALEMIGFNFGIKFNF